MTRAPEQRPPFSEALRTWTKIGLLSFGGPAGQIAMMHKVLVDEKRWLSERNFLSALNFCMLLPGPEAMQLATYSGWRLHGVAGGLAAGLLFVLPGAALMLVLALGYAAYGSLPVAEALFIGVKAAVLAIVVEALLRIAGRALKSTMDWLIAAAAFAGIFFLAVPFPIIILVAAIFGYFRAASHAPEDVPLVTISPAATTRTIGIWLSIWIVPLLCVAAVFGHDHVLSQIAWFFSKLAVVTFGGAYAVLAYMAQDAVQFYGWLTPGEMLDALGLAETTPGPLILVTEFVSTLAAWRNGSGVPVLMGLLGAIVSLWATFAPYFLFIFASAPYIERLNAEPHLRSALAAITAAVVGVVLNLTVWLMLHVLFANVDVVTFGPFQFHAPTLTSLQSNAAVLSVLAILLVFVIRSGIATTLGICGAAALIWHGIG